jgi:hypothetical protein
MAAADWVTTAEAKTALEISGTSRDSTIAAAITAASQALNARCRRELTPKTADDTRTFPIDLDLFDDAPYGRGLFPYVQGSGIVSLSPYDLASAAAVTLHPEEAGLSEVLAAGVDYALWPVGGSRLTGTYTKLKLARSRSSLISSYASRFGAAQLQIQGAWGVWDTADVPEDLKRACVVTVGSWIDKAIAEYGDEFADQPRVMQRTTFGGYAVPLAALTLLMDAGVVSTTGRLY